MLSINIVFYQSSRNAKSTLNYHVKYRKKTVLTAGYLIFLMRCYVIVASIIRQIIQRH